MVNLNRGMKNSFNNLDVNLLNNQGKVLDMFDISTYLNVGCFKYQRNYLEFLNIYIKPLNFKVVGLTTRQS